MSPTSTSPLPPQETLAFVQEKWKDDVVPTLARYIEIPAKSPQLRPGVGGARPHRPRGRADRGLVPRAAPIEGLTRRGRPPARPHAGHPAWTCPGTSADTVLLYGHCDKQPEMVGWADGLGPWTPVRRGDRLYGRGAGTTATPPSRAHRDRGRCRRAGAPHARCVVLIEACEESGSPDLPAYIDALAARIGTPDLVVCLDSGCGNYDQLWGTTSLRGIVNGHAHRRGADRGRALRRGERHRAVELPHPAAAPVAPRGRAHGRDPVAEFHVEIPAARA